MTKEEIMFKEVELYLESDLNQYEFSKGKDYTRHGLQYWLKKYRLQNPSEGSCQSEGHFQEINLSDGKKQAEKVMEITTKSGTQIIIYE
nr:hypothetical protein [uncultured Marinifilum sp.]